MHKVDCRLCQADFCRNKTKTGSQNDRTIRKGLEGGRLVEQIPWQEGIWWRLTLMSFELNWCQRWPHWRELAGKTLLTYVYHSATICAQPWKHHGGKSQSGVFPLCPGKLSTEEKGLQMSPAQTQGILVMGSPLRNSHYCIDEQQFKRTETCWIKALSLSPLENIHKHRNQIRVEIQLCSGRFDFGNNLEH